MELLSIAQSIEKPTLLLDKSRAVANINRMVSKASRAGVRLRPHFKTHQSAAIGEWFREQGVSAITVSSVDMAEYFAEHDWYDITIAFPVNIRQGQAIKDLAERIDLSLLFESADVATGLDRMLMSNVRAWIKIDTGYGRTGISSKNLTEIRDLAVVIQRCTWLDLAGILTHAGHTYSTSSPVEVVAIYEQTVSEMKAVQQYLLDHDIDVAVSVGDTPGCSLTPDLGEVDEIRPGNFVFFDLSQLMFGSCREEDIAVAIACPVVAKHEDRGQLLIYGGAIHFSKEYLLDTDDKAFYGRVSLLKDDSWRPFSRTSRLVSLSQEHGLVDADDGLLNEVAIGDILTIIPVHSCLTANLMGQYLTLDGDTIDMAEY